MMIFKNYLKKGVLNHKQPMDIIKTFENNNAGMHITIRGTHEEPLFRASDIAAILEIAQINSTIRDFDSTEKGVQIMHTIKGEQEVTFLTEKGLYEIMFRSRKPIAKTFKNWVCEVIKEIRINGKYHLEQQVTEVTKQLKDTESKLLNSKETTLLETYGNSRGVYMGFIDKNQQFVKFGHGIVGDRIKVHKKEIGEDFSLQYIIETIYDKELEQLIKSKLKDKIVSKDFPNRKSICKELIKLSHDYTIENLHNDILKLKKTLKDDLIESQKLIISDLKQRLSKYEDLTDEDQDEDEIEIIPTKNMETKPKKIMPLALTEKLKKRVYKFRIEPFELIASYNSIAEAAQEENISPVTLSRRIRVGTNMNGIIWSFSNEKPKEYFSTKNTIVYKLDTDLNIIQKFPSIAEAARLENIEITKMRRYIINNTLINDIVYSKTINPIIKIPKIINSKSVNKINANTGEIIKTFESSTEAALEIGVNQSAISRRIKNNTTIDGVIYNFVACN